MSFHLKKKETLLAVPIMICIIIRLIRATSNLAGFIKRGDRIIPLQPVSVTGLCLPIVFILIYSIAIVGCLTSKRFFYYYLFQVFSYPLLVYLATSDATVVAAGFKPVWFDLATILSIILFFWRQGASSVKSSSNNQNAVVVPIGVVLLVFAYVIIVTLSQMV